jgi:hypothetical protein
MPRIVRGRDLLSRRGGANRTRPLLIHQTYADADPRLLAPNTWTRTHPRALHVRWTDADNRALVRDAYPELLGLYDDGLRLTVQRTDLARLLYLHRYGGLYADADYEALRPRLAARLLVCAHKHRGGAPPPVRIVRSPVLLNEALQNSLMFAAHPGHPFFLDVARNMGEVFAFVSGGCTFSPSCALLGLFHHPLTAELAHVLLTQYMSGSALLDKTVVTHGYGPADVAPLPADAYFFGRGEARHLHANSWVCLGRATAPLALTLAAAWVASLVVACGCGGRAAVGARSRRRRVEPASPRKAR